MVWGCISAWQLAYLETPSVLNVYEHMLPSRWHLLQGRPGIFQQENAQLHTAAIIITWLHSSKNLGAELVCLQSPLVGAGGGGVAALLTGRNLRENHTGSVKAAICLQVGNRLERENMSTEKCANMLIRLVSC